MLEVAKVKLEADVKRILESGLEKAFRATFLTTADCDEADDMAKEFGRKGAKEMAGPLTDAIHNYVKSMDIVAVPTTLFVNVMGAAIPVTGTINTQTKQIQIQ